nr:hypothetical protein [uncultured Haemophilus sp.]
MGISEEQAKTKFKVDDSIFVLVAQVEDQCPELSNYPFACFDTKVKAIEGNSVICEYKGKAFKIGNRVCHKNIGILILNIGDFETELTLLDPLAKSVLQYCRLLFDDSYIKNYKIRTTEELSILWQREHKTYTHVIIIGHGLEKGISFKGENIIMPDVLKEIFDEPKDIEPKKFISLCCSTGKQSFAAEFSEMDSCECLIAPFRSIHGAIASSFLQTLFINHFLKGKSINVACKNALELNSTAFRIWNKGDLDNSTHKTK